MLHNWTVRIILVGILLVAMRAATGAALVNLDINYSPDYIDNYTGAAAVGGVGDQWNYLNTPGGGVASIASNNLVQADGAPSSVSFTMTAPAIYANHVSNFSGPGDEVNGLINDYAVILSGTATLTIANLKPNTAYDLYLYSTVSIYTYDTQFNFPALKTSSGGWPSGYVAGTNYVQYSGILSDGDGTVSGSLSLGSNGLGILNGFQIQGELPEPTGVALASLGAGAAFIRRRARMAR